MVWFDCRSSTMVRLPLINHAIDKASGIILAWHNGGRTDADFRQLLKYLQKIPIDLYYSDHWGAYTGNLPENCHYIGKNQTWKIERKKLNFRIHLKRLNRKTVCNLKAKRCMIMLSGCISNVIILKPDCSEIQPEKSKSTDVRHEPFFFELVSNGIHHPICH